MTTTTVETMKEPSKRSQIQEFFNGTNIFITGGTGFLGNVLIDKLFRHCPGINKIYLLVRPKKGKEIAERFKDIFDGPLFDRLKQEVPDFLSRVAAISGDCMSPDCGISPEDQEFMKNEINIVFHVAATVRFDAKMRYAVNINIRATRDLLALGRQMKNLKSFIHISTAYSNCKSGTIQESFYDPPFKGEAAINLVDHFDDRMLEKLTPALLGAWPNSYALTKCVAEDVVREEGRGMPVALLRPSIVIATAKDPIPGWINNYYGPTGVVAGAGLGLLRTIHADGNCIADLVPVDYVIGAIIAVAWNTGVTFVPPKIEPISRKLTEKEKSLDSSEIETSDLTSETEATEQTLLDEETEFKKKDSEIPVYNYVSSNQNPLTWKNYMTYNEVAAPEVPSKLAIWYYSLTLNKYKFMHLIYVFFLHLIPAAIVDGCTVLIGQKPRLLEAYKKIHNFSAVISYFSTKQWKFEDENVQKLWNKLSPEDQEMFYFNLRKLDWREYFYHHIRGIRVYLVHDSLDSVPEGRRKRFRFMVAHYTLVTIFYLFCSYVVYMGLFYLQAKLRSLLIES